MQPCQASEYLIFPVHCNAYAARAMGYSLKLYAKLL